ncbi:hypothetical protein CMUS01_16304 [Colletotrichum musicola]|uniref:Ketoreductase domain-containing protein n=2 Tax=Colletotrichum orchidearum species complex TaxID=2707337 RepID=A0A8H6MJM2_9PEZI|nr:hypothetical protein CSOJ01_15765 [Colletotrichum sojae]KAF6789975.1 hypothetical protein CMUS01_16304 [Colletotrichum musicola]
MENTSGDLQLQFDGRVAAITGGAQGMGREHAILLGKRGARIVVNDLDGEGAESTAEAIRVAGGEAVVVHGSIAQKEVAQTVVEVAIATWGRIDIVINNAGIEIKKPFLDFTDEDFSRMMAVHVWGSWMLTQLAWPHMRKQKYGRVLMVLSATIAGMPGYAAYTVAKGALFGLGRTLAVEGQADGITVNMFGPFANTAMARQIDAR